MKTQLNQFTLPPEAVLIRRMHGVGRLAVCDDNP